MNLEWTKGLEVVLKLVLLQRLRRLYTGPTSFEFYQDPSSFAVGMDHTANQTNIGCLGFHEDSGLFCCSNTLELIPSSSPSLTNHFFFNERKREIIHWKANTQKDSI